MTGIILIDKPKDITSFGAVARVRRICGEKKCGHTGTLDPMATGLLTVMLGGATRFSMLLPSHDKAYRAEFRLGTVTDTLDITGKVLETRPVSANAAQVAAALAEFVGEIEQLPPMYSAVSVNGKRLYDLARQGVEVEREPRRVTVYSAEILEAKESAGEYAVSVECSSGTYIRTLISDLGEKLGCGAVLTELRRTAANGFKIDSAVTLEALSQAAEIGELDRLIIPVDRALEEYPIITVSAAQARRFGNGGELSLERLKYPRTLGLFRIYDPDGAFMGLGEIGDGDSLKVKRVFVG
ncbi:MAG: tRNA pseudouridine(55) synthase TruB [Oscillospiraceae bacterium]|nr:tRNA pseudouridine(55) synthase TruB [Oscillospiraceae bacterium]